jgi:hypothetical protein
MKNKWHLLVALLAFSASVVPVDAPSPNATPRKLELDDSLTGDFESMNEKMELFDELDTPTNDLELSKSEIDYFVNKNIDDSRPEPPMIIIQTPIQTTIEEGDENGYQPQPLPTAWSVVPPQMSEIEETHEYLVQHDLVLDLHHQHLIAAYQNLQDLEAQFVALADELDTGHSKLQIDANTKDLLTNFAAHLVYIQDEQVYEHDNPAPPLYDWYTNRIIDFEAIIDEAEKNETALETTTFQKVQDLSFESALNRTVNFNQSLEQGTGSETWLAAKAALEIKPNSHEEGVQAQETNSKGVQWHIKSDFLQEAKPWVAKIKARKNMVTKSHNHVTRVARPHHRHHRRMRDTKSRHAMVVETDSGFRYPFQHDRNPWAKTRFEGYVRPLLHDSFEQDNLLSTNSTLDDILLYYDSSFNLLEPTPQHESMDAIIDPTDDVHTYYRIKSFSEIGYFVLEQIWNDLNQVNTDFHTVPNTHLNSLAFFGLRPLHDKVRCDQGTDAKKLKAFDEAVQERHGEFREHVALVVASIEACEDDVFAILSLIEFYRNYKGSAIAGTPEFMELINRSKEDLAELHTLHDQAEERVNQLKEDLGRFEENKQGFLRTLADFEVKGSVWVVRIGAAAVLLFLNWT